jgi:hypothetical protein
MKKIRKIVIVLCALIFLSSLAILQPIVRQAIISLAEYFLHKQLVRKFWMAVLNKWAIQGVVFSVVVFVLAAYLFYQPRFTDIFVSQKSYSHEKWFLVNLGLSVILSFLYVGFFFNKAFPLTEGWYSVFAKYINSGKIPYRDFDFHFTPLYAYIIAFITKLFGYDIIVLRCLGIVVFIGITVAAYLIFSKLFGPTVSMISSVVAVIFMQSELPQIFYDYIRFYDLFTYLALLFLLIFLDKNSANKPSRYLLVFLTGIFASIAFLIRQNSGAIVAFYILLLLLFYLIVSKQKKRIFLFVYAVSIIIPIIVLLLFMAASHSLTLFIESIAAVALSSKGGLFVVLFAWIPRYFSAVINSLIVIIVLFLFLMLFYFCNKPSFQKQVEWKKHDIITSFSFFFLFLIILFGCFFYPVSQGKEIWFSSLPVIVYTISISFFVIMLYNLTISKRPVVDKTSFGWSFLALTGFVIAVGYGSGTSAGLSEGQTALAAGTIVAVFLSLSYNKFMFPIRMALFIGTLYVLFNIFNFKMNVPYTWWGLTEDNIRTASRKIDVPYMNGIYVSPSKEMVVEGVVNDINRYSISGDDVFIFPHIPIFYMLTEKYPKTFTTVQWFDVSSPKAVDDDMVFLKSNRPNVIVLCHIPEGVKEGHEKLFANGNKSSLRKMQEALYNMIGSDEYFVVNEYLQMQSAANNGISGDYKITVYARLRN